METEIAPSLLSRNGQRISVRVLPPVISSWLSPRERRHLTFRVFSRLRTTERHGSLWFNADFEQSQTRRLTPGLSSAKHPRSVTSSFSNLCNAPSLSSVICPISRP